MLITYNSITYDEQYLVGNKNTRTHEKYSHAVLELLFVIDGETEININSQDFVVRSKEVILIPHNKPYRKKVDSPDASKLIRMIFWNNDEEYWNNGQYKREMKELEKKFPRIMKINEAIEKLLETIKLLIPCLGYNNGGGEKQPIFMNLGEAILSILFIGHTSKEKEISPIILNAIDYIKSKYHKDISLDDIAKHVCLGKRQLLNLFKEYNFESPIKYLWKHRIKEAIELLKYSDMEIKEIAWNTGFNNISHFHRKIKIQTGKTPKEIIRKINS